MSDPITKEYLKSLCNVYYLEEKERTVAYIKRCVIDAAKAGSTTLIIDNFHYGKCGSGIRGGMVLPTNTAGLGIYNGTSCYYHIVLDSLEDLRKTFIDCVVDVSEGRLCIDWS
jgi:hypothetical protein